MDTPHPLIIFRERHHPRMTQTALAERLGVTRAAVCRWEAGTRIPRSPEVLTKIASITGIQPIDMFAARNSK